MSAGFQVTFDAGDPRALGKFWAQVLGYVEPPPPAGFDTLAAYLASLGVPADHHDAVFAIVDPDRVGPRLLFQRVPEGKTAKNRVHLDVNAGAGFAPPDRKAMVQRRADELIALGATAFAEIDEYGEYCVVLLDPEGNEFCVQ